MNMRFEHHYLIMLLLVLFLGGRNSAWGQDETYNFKEYQEQNATIVFDNSNYEGIENAHPATNITVNNATIQGLHSNFGIRFAFCQQTNKGWHLNRESGSQGRHGLRCMGSPTELAIRNCWNGDRVIITYNSEKKLKIKEANSAKINGAFVEAGQKFDSGTEITAVKAQGNGYANDIIITVEAGSNDNYNWIEKIDFHYQSGSPAISTTSPSNVLTVGDTFTPSLTVIPSTSTPVFSSSNTAVAKVDMYGKVTAEGVGTATITASLTVGNQPTRTASYDVTVKSATSQTTTYDYTGCGNASTLVAASETTIDGEAAWVLQFNNQQYGSKTFNLNNIVAIAKTDANIGDGGDRWFLSTNGICNYFSGDRTLYVTGLYNGDKVKIIYDLHNDGGGPAQCKITSDNASVASGNVITSGSEFALTSSGNLKLAVGAKTLIKQIIIEHEAKPSFRWSEHSFTYKITDMNFAEPTAIKSPPEASHTVRSLNTSVAIMDEHNPGDVLFVNTGSVNIQGTMKTNGQDYRDTYTVNVWADVATYTDTNNRYELTGIGKLQEKEVDAVNGLTMNFGSDDDATLVLYDQIYNAYVAYTINKNTGWRHRNGGAQSSVPTNGSFYKFQALTSGKLRFSGVKNGDDNTVVLMDANTMSGDPVYSIAANEKGIKGTGTDSYVQLTAGHTYYLFGNVPEDGDYNTSTWSAYMLTWFSFEPDFKLVNTFNGVENEVAYGAAPRTNNTDITSVSNVVTIKGDTNPEVTVVGYSGGITAAKASVTVSGSNSILNVSNISGTGGAIRIKVESSAGGTAYFNLTIPYATHAWDFRTGTGDGETGQSRENLASEIKNNGTNSTLNLSGITRIYRSVNKTSAGVWEHIGDPILAANGKVEGDNGFFIGKTSGLMFVTPGGANFGALETQCTWQKPTTTTNQETGDVTVTGYTATTETSYSADRGLTEVDDETEYYFGPEVTDKAEYVYMKTGTKIIFPGVRPGQYIKIYTRRLSNLGDHWRAENLVDLEDKAYTSATEFTYLGINEDRNSTNNTPHAWAGDNLKGSAMFKVPTNYDATNTDISKMPSLTVTNGWVRLVKIELMDEYKTDLYLSETTKSDNKFYKVDYDSKFASVVVYKKNGVATPVEKFYQGTVGKIGSTHAHTCEYEVEKIPETLNITETRSTTGANNYNELTLTFNGGTGLVKIVQKEYGDDTGITTRADQHIINKKETYISVSEVNVQTYPYTWDFTNHNMYQGSSTTAENLAAASGSGYGSWTKQGDGNTFQMKASATINTTMQQKNISETSYEQVTKPLYAQGGQFTAGTTVVAEAEGLGISRPYGADRTQYTWATESDTFGRREYTYKTYDLTSPITIDGSALSGAGIVTIPQVDNGMYVFVKANNKPSWTSTDIIDMWVNSEDNKDPFNVANGVWLFKNIGATQDIVFTFPDNSVITTIAVTNIEKTINELGYASESRNHAIDHTYQATLTKQPVKAYAITTYDGETYNYKGYPTVKRSENALRTVPANTGIVLYQDPSDIPDDGWKDKSFVSPLFYPAVNNATPSSQDETTLASNWMAPNVESSVHTSETENRNDVECTKFVMARTFYTYSKTYGDSGDKTSSVEAFYRLRIMGNESDDRIAADKAYLLIPTAKLPVALWNNGSGEGIAGKARQGVIYFDLQELEEREAATAIKHIANESDADYRKEHTYFTMSGTRISGTPKAKGLYIREDGKKVWIK